MGGGGRGTLTIYMRRVLTTPLEYSYMKNIRKFEMMADKDAAVLEEYSVSYVIETNKVYTTPENGGQSNVDYSTMYTTFEALEDGTFSFTKNGTGDDIQYSKNNGSTWTSLASGETVSVVTGDKVMWKYTITPNYGIGTFSSSNKFNASGNIMSLLYSDDFNGQTSLEGKGNAFKHLFSNCKYLIDSSNLILPPTTLVNACYASMFQGCTSLTTAPELPATTLVNACYASMFQGCTSLTTAPELPATTLVNNCYDGMFQGCTSLTATPELPATTLANYCYRYMFNDCTSLTTVPSILPATTLEDCCYYMMFDGCTSLTTAPELPATTLAIWCYYYMFSGCENLTTAPSILPATTLKECCYFSMFGGCTSLTTAPELPATKLAKSCYGIMFSGCTSLTTAPELPATTLATQCYDRMFAACTSLTTAPELPATTLATQCYKGMFSGCTSLTTAPELPATTFVDYCYSDMFSGCINLNHITMLATNGDTTSTSYYLFNWVKGVSSTGTFVKHPDMTSLSTGASGIPSGWTVEDAVL